MKQTLQNKIALILAAISMAILPLMAAVPQVAHGQDFGINDVLGQCDETTGLNCDFGEGGLTQTAQRVITIALGLAFLIAVGVLIYGGFKYILSAGNEESAKQGRTAIFNALIGIVIIVLSYVIVQIVYQFITGTGN